MSLIYKIVSDVPTIPVLLVFKGTRNVVTAKVIESSYLWGRGTGTWVTDSEIITSDRS